MSKNILVFPRELIKNYNGFYEWENCRNLIEDLYYYGQWIERDIAEKSENLIQATACAFLYNESNKYVVFQSTKSNKLYLNEKYSLIVGGHVDFIDDVSVYDVLTNTLHREISEEISISSNYNIEQKGIIIDQSSVEKSKHMCFLYKMIIKNCNIAIKSYNEFKDTVDYRTNQYLYANCRKFDPWSQIIINRVIDY